MSAVDEPRPVRLAVLGGESTGKTALVSRLTLNIVHEVHYPTRNQNNWLFEFIPRSKIAKTILDSQAHERLLRRTPGSESLEPIFKSPSVNDDILLSPLTFQAFTDNFGFLKAQQRGNVSNSYLAKNAETKKSSQLKHSHSREQMSFSNYISSTSSSSLSTDFDAATVDYEGFQDYGLPVNYVPPTYNPIPIDIIDTPGFKPEMVVPFLEVSLFRNLDKSVLRGLANEPRQPVSTTSLLVASGASELNGKIDGYILVYSAIPELSHHSIPDPPNYDEDVAEPSASSLENQPNDTAKNSKSGGLSLLPVIRSCILDAWTEFRNYKTNWAMGQEADIYSLVHSLKGIWKYSGVRARKLKKVNKMRTFKTHLDTIDLNPASPDSPPPCIIVCTHIHDPMASPLLVERGRDMATQWNSSFVAVDNLDDYNVDVTLSLIIKDIVEKEKLLNNAGDGTSDFVGQGRHNSLGKTSGSMLKKIMKP
ncbi:uncharacterized protein KNAG_0A07380 [Huiozyma naganishii CBS 8797]|uniref:Uncharacterized protein n=1 Tax=Huiozyma naganishii (strain ATCC MYA-139 / BCRC 22969 / CBS 8797 / KCTC 17520 / NBRC 10181 / NCYC 3082 / Yp74L-3) TaxID=1071383 RepID=J7S451_HUIN7|nr:hypothetical protein KNAG_0A07380 [Kazachstania naganishii CBS 8797]CCK68391.1 hypothetical protein KNAG_0A07380 [Kazachstania naganishii CBS 8797]